MNTSFVKGFLCASTAGIGLLAAQPALAQQTETASTPPIAPAPEAPPAAGDPNALQDIIITATHRSESLQKVPLAVSAFSGDLLRTTKVTSVADIAPLTPNFRYNQFSVGQVDLFIRGVGTDLGSAGSDNSVGAFIDDVYIARSSGVTGTPFDMERIEVVRGPSGALYGKNTIGGAINFVTAKPSFDESGSFRVDYGNYDYVSGQGYVTGKITDKLAGRLAYSGSSRSGFDYNTQTRNHDEDMHSQAVRGSLLYEDGGLKALLTADYSSSNGSGNWRWQDPVTDRNLPFHSPDPRVGSHNTDGKQESRVGGVMLRVDADTSVGTITSITGYRSNYFDFVEDVLGMPWIVGAPPLDNPDLRVVQMIREKSTQFSQELRFSGNLMADKLRWTVSGFYLREHVVRDDNTDQNLNFYPFLVFPNNDIAHMTNVTHSYSALAQLEYSPTSWIDLNASIRWNKDSKNFTDMRAGVPTQGSFNTPDGKGFTVNAKTSSDAFTPRFAVNVHLSPSKLLYGTVSRGYKSAAFDGIRALSPQEAGTPAAPEYAWAYEVGFKGDFFDHRVRFNVDGFYTDYTNLQTTVIRGVPPVNLLANAGRVISKGIEVETSAKLFRPFRIEGSYGYLHSRITGDLFEAGVNLKGNVTRRSPEHSGSVSGVIDQRFGDGSQILGRLSYQFNSSYFFDNNNQAATKVKGSGQLAANLDYTLPNGKWTLSIWGRNLTDDLYIRHTTAVAGTGYVLLGPPRTFGGGVTYKF